MIHSFGQPLDLSEEDPSDTRIADTDFLIDAILGLVQNALSVNDICFSMEILHKCGRCNEPEEIIQRDYYYFP